MNKTLGALLLAALVVVFCTPDLLAQRDGKQGDKQGAKNQDRQQKGKRRGGRRMRPDDAPKIGDVAPTFKLKSLEGESETNLADYKGEKPVLLFFGSYT